MTDCISILGLGLMGGSLGLALKKFAPSIRVAGYARREETRVSAISLGAVDEAFPDPVEAARGAGIVIACVPVQTIPRIVRAAIPGLSPGAVMTDVGSTKAKLCAELSAEVSDAGGRFVGAHPIAGSELQGLDAARADLYRGAVVIVTPGENEKDQAALVSRMWATMGATVVSMRPEEHDRMLAKTSHLPHMVAVTLAASVAQGGEFENKSVFCGPGFHDTTRVAAGSPQVWLDILRTNQEGVYRELASFRDHLDQVLSWLDEKDFDALDSFLKASKKAKERLAENSNCPGGL